ncbi:pyridine nucleotide-disulfide oxidoreductase [Frondihabitans sucicola]|uniref:Pyridine nucleotide-disulfide oxidoreductase n=2 Tax=Frondihabitans sucicola TaxID=1268041 RepID=A0ABM8GJN7_9MICO|nr:pyridine nucleotide-disulfide oxidoreductase [Frondihabitans sucicola]
MSICGHDDNHFTRWHHARFGPSDPGHLFATRPAFGDYLRESLTGLRDDWARREGVLQLVPYAVDRIRRDGSKKFSVETNNSVHAGFDDVILCPGWSGFTTGPRPGATISAYPLRETVRRISPDDSVLVLGTGLTGVDVVRALLQRGHEGRIDMVSRRGFLPSVRPGRSAHRPHLYTRQAVRDAATFSVRRAIGLLEAEAEVCQVDLREPEKRMRGLRTPQDALRRGVAGLDDPWTSLLVGVADEAVSESWNRFDVADRRVFLRALHPYFQSWCNPMPSPTAALLLGAIDAEQLGVHAGVGRGNSRGASTDSGDDLAADVVVQAYRSAHEPFVDVQSGMLGRMIADGLARPDPFGGFALHYGTSRVIDSGGTALPIYAIGGLAQGARYYVSALDGIVDAVQGVVRHIVRTMGADPIERGSCSEVVEA